MKKVVLVIAVLMLFAMGSVAYAGQFGPPEPAAKEGKISLGAGYFYNSAKLKPKNTEDWSEEKISQNQAYLQLSYGFVKNWETYLRVGGADIKVKDFIRNDKTSLTNAGQKDFKDGLKPFGTLGIKGLLYDSASFGIGPFIQATLYSTYEDEWTWNELGWSKSGGMKTKFKKPRDINLGVSAQVKIGDIILYAGPVAYWYRVKVEDEITNPNSNEATTFKEKNNVGGFAGLKIPLGKGLSIEVEGQYKSKFSAGGALVYSF